MAGALCRRHRLGRRRLPSEAHSGHILDAPLPCIGAPRQGARLVPAGPSSTACGAPPPPLHAPQQGVRLLARARARAGGVDQVWPRAHAVGRGAGVVRQRGAGGRDGGGHTVGQAAASAGCACTKQHWGHSRAKEPLRTNKEQVGGAGGVAVPCTGGQRPALAGAGSRHYSGRCTRVQSCLPPSRRPLAPPPSASLVTPSPTRPPAQAALLLRKFLRDTWDDPTGVIGSWGGPEHGAFVSDVMHGGLGL